MKKIFYLLISLALLCSITACGTETLTTDTETVPTENAVESTVPETAEPDTATVEEEKTPIILTAGEMGEYGSEMTLNAGTEVADTFIAYHVPAGTYTVTNKGEYMNQISVYSDETHITDEGWEEPAETGDVKVIDAGKSDTITIADNQYIEITEPACFELILQ